MSAQATERVENGKVALMIGGGQGIGEAAIKRLHRDGFRVAVGDLNLDTARKVAQDLGGEAAGAIAIEVNAADRDSVYAAVDQTVEKLGGFDVIINNAGIAPQIDILDVTERTSTPSTTSTSRVSSGASRRRPRSCASWATAARSSTPPPRPA